MNSFSRSTSFVPFIVMLLFSTLGASDVVFAQENVPEVKDVRASAVSDRGSLFDRRLMVSTYGCVSAFGKQDSECFSAPFAVIEIRWYHPDNIFNGDPNSDFSFFDVEQPGSTRDESAGVTYANDRNSGPIPEGVAQPESQPISNNKFGPVVIASSLDPLADIPNLYHGGMNSFTFEYSRFLNPPPFGGLERRLNLQAFVGFGFARTTKDMSRGDDRYVTVDYENAFPMFSYGLDLGFSVVQSNQIQIRFKLRGQTYMPPNRLNYMLIENIQSRRVVTPFTSTTSSFTKIDFLIGIGFLL